MMLTDAGASRVSCSTFEAAYTTSTFISCSSDRLPRSDAAGRVGSAATGRNDAHRTTIAGIRRAPRRAPVSLHTDGLRKGHTLPARQYCDPPVGSQGAERPRSALQRGRGGAPAETGAPRPFGPIRDGLLLG